MRRPDSSFSIYDARSAHWICQAAHSLGEIVYRATTPSNCGIDASKLFDTNDTSWMGRLIPWLTMFSQLSYHNLLAISVLRNLPNPSVVRFSHPEMVRLLKLMNCSGSSTSATLLSRAARLDKSSEMIFLIFIYCYGALITFSWRRSRLRPAEVIKGQALMDNFWSWLRLSDAINESRVVSLIFRYERLRTLT